MRDTNTIVRDRQRTIRRQLDLRGISLKGVAFDSGIPYPTVCSYFSNEKDKEPATIGGAALFMLCGGVDGEGPALPLDLLSLLLPEGFQVVRLPEEIDHRDVGQWAADYLARKNAAHDPASECAEAIGPTEQLHLDRSVAQFPRAA